MGPHFVQFLRESYERAKVTGCWKMAAQPDMESTSNTRAASTYWDVRLSAAVAVTAADVQSRLIRRDETLNLRVMGRQPTPTPTTRRTRVALLNLHGGGRQLLVRGRCG